MAYENILFEVTDGVAVITFNRPKALNAINGALLNELSAALDEIEGNEDIRVLVLTGAGDKAFVAGADITELATFNTLQGKLFSRKGQLIFNRLQEMAIPVVAAVNGFALGGGSEIALASDFIYASENATFGLPEITLGIIPGFGGTQRLARLVGINRAKEMIFTGSMVPAPEAEKIGLVNRVFPQDKLMDETLKTAKGIAKKGKVSLREAKKAVNTGLNVELGIGCQIEADAFGICLASPDAKEGTGAFIEKRKAVFKGSLLK
ncbi:enoyl-CoA hydratase-isomerase [Desulfosarcina cetonica]|uniref:enoyl-CoA hydratase/isomerase family protein n=1 Tax=Desulfosarcina cetonica TaxID=90730 RepID=UPI0006CF7DB6|nr:enoyl-CoA hydratase-related protein [Desulfosarcina cetonica]VTR64656.1 enoyl-CoA hydratase-isomerase [Desulfosarcina cetonica]